MCSFPQHPGEENEILETMNIVLAVVVTKCFGQNFLVCHWVVLRYFSGEEV